MLTPALTHYHRVLIAPRANANASSPLEQEGPACRRADTTLATAKALDLSRAAPLAHSQWAFVHNMKEKRSAFLC